MCDEPVAQCPIDTPGRAQRGFPLRLRRGPLRGEVGERGACLPQLCVELINLGLLLRGRGRDERRRIHILERLAAFRDVVEVGKNLVKLLLGDRVELVVVTAGTPEGQTQPHRRGRRDAIDGVLHQELVRDDAAFAVLAMVPVEGGGYPLIEGRVGQHVARDLLDGELIERYVVVVGVDHPVAPPPHRPFAVCLIPVGIGVARGIQPFDRHPFTVSG